MDETSADFHERRSIFCQLFVVCRSIWFDNRKPEDSFSLGKVSTKVLIAENETLPLRLSRFAYFQLWGDAGDYQVKVRLVRIELNEEDEEVEVPLTRKANPRDRSWRTIEVTNFDLVCEFAIPIDDLLIETTGCYEFKLLCRDATLDDEFEFEQIASYRIEVL